MAKKPMHKFVSPEHLHARVEKALQEGRTQQALELAKELSRAAPTPENQELLQKTYLARGRQLRLAGHTRDAVTVLDVAARLPNVKSEFLGEVASEMSLCGDAARVQALLTRFPADSPERAALVVRAVDSSVRGGAAARNPLPAELQGEFDRILQAAQHIENGKEEEAREALQGIGLRSPFMEWKLMLRGLGLYYRGEDARALENWQRLNPERLPARIVAPFRILIDKDYLSSLPPATQTTLQNQANRIRGGRVQGGLQEMQKALLNRNSLDLAFQLAASNLPVIRAEEPRMVPRIASCYYWAIVEKGHPGDVGRYDRLFGAPREDVRYFRLQALIHEPMAPTEAHKYWKHYEEWVAANASLWNTEEALTIRALIWNRMGINAANVPDLDHLDLPPILANHPSRPRPLKPDAITCFQRSLALMPKMLETHIHLIRTHVNDGDDHEATGACEKLLEHFPDHLPTLQRVANLFIKEKKYSEALEVLEKVSRVNPLDREVRLRIARVHGYEGRLLTENGEFEAARAALDRALSLGASRDPDIRAARAVLEFKDGQAKRGEELLQQALEEAKQERLAMVAAILVDVIRLKLPAKIKTQYNKEFNELLAQPATGPNAALLARMIASNTMGGVTYHGQKTHDKKVLAYLKKAAAVPMSEEELREICTAMNDLVELRLLKIFADRGHALFPNNPRFTLWVLVTIAESQSYISMHAVPHLVRKARMAIEAMPDGYEKEELESELEELEEQTQIEHGGGFAGFMDAFRNTFGGGFNPFDAFGGDDDDD